MIHLKTWTITFHESDEFKDRRLNKKASLFAHWHGDELALLPCVTKYELATMVSKSNDGELMAYLIHKLGGYSSRGSSSRNAISALKQLIRLCRKGRSTSMAVDGPKGPIYKVKPGIFEVSRLTGLPIFPLASATNKSINFSKSWNKTFLPKLFANVEIVVGKPIQKITHNDNLKTPKLKFLLANGINSTKQQALSLIAKT